MDRRRLPEGARLSQWTAPDGWTIRRMDWPQPSGAGVRGSLVFAGGRGDFIEKYLEAHAHWHGRGWGVTAFDWRGQGGSAGNIVGGHVDSFDPLVEDGAAFIEKWRATAAGPHVAVGHSMGGHLLLRVLVERRPALAAAVLVAPMLGINAAPLPDALGAIVAKACARLGASRRRIWQEGSAGSARSRFRQPFLTGSVERFDDEQWWKAQNPGFALGAPSWGWMRAAYASLARLTPDTLRSVRVPLLLLGTARDRLVSPAAIRNAAALLPDAELHIYAAAAHELLREADAVRTDALARIDAFLDAHAPAP